MDRILFLLISIAFTILMSSLLPLGFNKKEKIALMVASTFIGLFGLVSIYIAPLWQVMLMMAGLAAAVGYMTVNHFLKAEDVTPLGQPFTDNPKDVELVEDITNFKEVQQKEIDANTAVELIPIASAIGENNVAKEPFIDIEEDISFLEARNRFLTESMGMDVDGELPVFSFDSGTHLHVEDEINEPEQQRVIASSHS